MSSAGEADQGISCVMHCMALNIDSQQALPGTAQKRFISVVHPPDMHMDSCILLPQDAVSLQLGSCDDRPVFMADQSSMQDVRQKVIEEIFS